MQCSRRCLSSMLHRYFPTFSPDDSYCWNRHLYPSQITSTEQLPRLRLETIVGECMAYIFSGFYEQWMIGPSSYISLRMERCIDNAGHRYFNRGISSAGYTANTARLRLYYNATLVYTLFRAPPAYLQSATNLQVHSCHTLPRWGS